jgi:carbonic anhydrase
MTTQAPVKVNLLDPFDFKEPEKETSSQYEFNYATSSTVVSKQDTYLKFNFDSKDAEIKAGEVEFEVQEVRLYRGSLTDYEGANVSAEMIIHHVEINGKKNLLVHIPIISTQDKVGSSSNDYLKNLLPYIQDQDPSPTNSGSNTESNEITFSEALKLNNFVKQRPFFLTSTTLPYPPNNGDNYTIFFSPNIHPILIDQSVENILNNLLSVPDVSNTSIDDSLIFYNKSGSINLSKSDGDTDDIYIDCSPTGDTLIPLDELQKQEGLEPELSFYDRIKKFFEKYSWIESVLISFIVLIIMAFVFRLDKKIFTKEIGVAEGIEQQESRSGNTGK